MSRFYLRPDQVYQSGQYRPAADSENLHAEVAAIARAFTRDPNVIAQQYVATVPTMEPVTPPGSSTDLHVGPTAQVAGFIAKFFGRK